MSSSGALDLLPTGQPEPDRIYVLAALQRRGANYGFVLRWLLGASNDDSAQANDLPRLGDKFEVRIRRLSGGGGYLQADGKSWGAAEHAFVKEPMPFAMIDPPRVSQDIPGYDPAGTQQWLVAAKPTAPVDPAVNPDEGLRTEDGSKALGVVHLLEHTDQMSVAWEMARQFSRILARSAKHVDTLASRLGMNFEEAADRTALDLAELAMRGRPRAWELMAQIDHGIKALEAGLHGETTDEELSRQWIIAGLLAATLSNREAVASALKVRDDAERVRSQLRLRCLQGGRMIDFWADGLNPSPAEEERGKQWTAADLFGLGLVVGDFTEAEVRSWINLRHGSADVIAIEVRHVPAITHSEPATPFRERNGKPASFGRLFLEHAVLQYKPGAALLRPQDIKLALSEGSSSPPKPPSEAFVSYDLVRNWIDPEKLGNDIDDPAAGSALSYGTGDGRIEILIRRDADQIAAAENNVMGFNIYGVWEGASPTTDLWFSGGEPIGINALKPWLITRRYSRLRDLDGALPPFAGSMHPSLAAEFGDPSWHPAMIRAASIEDRTLDDQPANNADRELPNVLKPGLTVWSHDLRQGMGNAAHAMRAGWDPAAPVLTGWTPYYWRQDDVALPSARPRPQRYRFWVTAVDGLDQESAPVPVKTADRDIGEAETFTFSPRYRTQLPFPAEQPGGGAMRIEATPARDRIDVSFPVPTQFHLGGRDLADVQPPKIDPGTLKAKVLLLRRRLVRRVEDDEPGSLRTLLAEDPVFSSPAWNSVLASLEDEGWARWQVADLVPPTDGSPCEAAFGLSHIDRGFEYRAIAGFVIADRYAPFWFPAAAERTIQATVKVGDRFEAVVSRRPEAPAIGGVGITPVLPLPNHAPPRNGVVGKAAAGWAKPVLPPPGVNRDLVLMRLLANPVEADDAAEAMGTVQEWLDEGLNIAQAHMAHAAMARVDLSAVGAPSPEQWGLIRKIVSHDLKQPQGGLRQHGLIGFRGLMALRWSYLPLAGAAPPPPRNPSDDSEAEATLFRLFMARAPKHIRGDGTAALVLNVVSEAASTYSVDPVTVEADLLRLLTSGMQPALVAMRSANADPVFAMALSFSATGSQVDKVRLEPMDPAKPLPKSAGTLCHVYLASPYAEVQNSHFEGGAAALSCYLPIGGGPEEAIAWWVASVSAQETLSPMHGWPRYLQSFHASISVAAPAAPAVRTVLRSNEPFLDRTFPSHWLPEKLTDATARFEARLYVTWDPKDFPANAWIEIDRIHQRVGEKRDALRLLSDPEEWHAIKAIEGTPNDAPIKAEWVDLVARNWLQGRPVEPDPATPLPAEPYVFVGTRPLPSQSGLKLVAPEEGDPPRPALIDYFAWDKQNLMESDTEYKYRIRVVQDIAPGAPPDWRYLRSEWSPFSPFVVPLRPELNVLFRTASDRKNGLNPPSVEFVFQTSPDSGVATCYRILLQRKVRSALLATAGDAHDPFVGWRDVGSIVELAPGDVDEIVLRDEELERPGELEPLAVHYRMRVVHYAVSEESERLLRKAPNEPIEFTVNVPVPAGQPAQEWTRVQVVALK